jgi:hypothetical protein
VTLRVFIKHDEARDTGPGAGWAGEVKPHLTKVLSDADADVAHASPLSAGSAQHRVNLRAASIRAPRRSSGSTRCWAAPPDYAPKPSSGPPSGSRPGTNRNVSKPNPSRRTRRNGGSFTPQRQIARRTSRSPCWIRTLSIPVASTHSESRSTEPPRGSETS